MRPANTTPPGSRRYGPLAARSAGAPRPLATPVLRWNTDLGPAVRAVAWLPDHSAVLGLTIAGQLVRLNAADGSPAWDAGPSAGGALCLGVCPTAPIVATGHLDGSLRLRNAHTGKIVAQHRLGRAWVEHLSWSPDGRLLAAACGADLHLLDEVGQPHGVFRPAAAGITALHWMANSCCLAVGTATGQVALISTSA